MSDNFTTLLKKSMQTEYDTFDLNFIQRSNDIHCKQIKYIKHCFSIPQSVNYPIAFTLALTKLPSLHLKHVTDTLFSNLNIFISNETWFQILCNNLTSNSSFLDFINWNKAGQPLEINFSGIDFEELQPLYTKELFSHLSMTSKQRISEAMNEISANPLPLKNKLELLNISKSTYVSEFTNGCSNKISKRRLFTISRATGYSPDYLLDLTDQPTMYYSNFIPKVPLPEWFYVLNTPQSKNCIVQKLNHLFSTNKNEYYNLREKNNFTEDYLKNVRNSNINEIPVKLINELGRIYNIHPLCLTGQIKKFVPYKIKDQKVSKQAVTQAVSFSKYKSNYINASDALDELENNINNPTYELLCNCLFLLFVYFDIQTRNNILDFFSDSVNMFITMKNFT